MTDAVDLTREQQDANLHPGRKDADVKINGSPRSVASPRKVSTKPKRMRRCRSWRMPRQWPDNTTFAHFGRNETTGLAVELSETH